MVQLAVALAPLAFALALLAPTPLQASAAAQNGDHATAIDGGFDDVEPGAPGCAAGVAHATHEGDRLAHPWNYDKTAVAGSLRRC